MTLITIPNILSEKEKLLESNNMQFDAELAMFVMTKTVTCNF